MINCLNAFKQVMTVFFQYLRAAFNNAPHILIGEFMPSYIRQFSLQTLVMR